MLPHLGEGFIQPSSTVFPCHTLGSDFPPADTLELEGAVDRLLHQLEPWSFDHSLPDSQLSLAFSQDDWFQPSQVAFFLAEDERWLACDSLLQPSPFG